MTPCVDFKAGVTLGDPPTPCQVRLLAVCDQGARLIGHSLTVTCGRDSHAASDPHTRGLALDVRTRDLPDGPLLALIEFLRKTLGLSFTVLYETPTKPTGVLAGLAYVNPKASAPHLHIQLNKGLTAWP